MRERGIIFTGESVRAILAGRKTQTRRVARFKDDGGYSLAELAPHRHVWECHKQDGTPQWQDYDNIIPNRYGVPGDRLWVRETWAYKGGDEMLYQKEPRAVIYRADEEWSERDRRDWRSPLLLPRWAARLTLEVVAVRVERVQEITVGDALAEGIDDAPHAMKPSGIDMIEDFGRAWDRINGKRFGCAWSDNPWVWVITFRKREGSAPWSCSCEDPRLVGYERALDGAKAEGGAT